MGENKSQDEIKKTMMDLVKRIQKKCEGHADNGQDIYFLALALKEVNSVRATLPKDFLIF